LDAVAELTQERYRDYKARMLAPDSDFTDEDRKALTEQETQVPHRFGIPESRVGLASVHGPGHFALGIQVVQARDAARQPSGVSFVARTPQARDPAILRLQPGDRILAVNERPVRTREEFADLVDALDCRRPATMTILDVNSGRSLTIQVKSHCQP
jgi:hypothetical protein